MVSSHPDPSAPDSLDSAYSWFRLAVTLLIATIGSVGIWAYISVLPAVEAEFATGRGASSAPYAVTMLGFACGNFIMGRVVDRFGAARAQMAAAGVLAAGFAAASIAPSMPVLIAVHAVVGFGSSVSFGPLMADISHWFIRRRGIAVTVTASGNYLAGAIWPLLLSDVLAEAGWRQVYLILAVIVISAVAPLSLLLRRRAPAAALAKAGAEARAAAMTAGLSPRALQWLLMLAGLACCTAMAMPQVHIVAYCVDLGYGPAAGAEMLSLMLLGGVVSRVASGALADWIGGARTLVLGSALQGVALLFYLPYDGLVSLYIVSAVFGLSQGGIVPAYAIIVREYMAPEEAGSRVGIVIMSTILGMALGGWMSGWIYDLTGSYAMAFLNGFAWNVLNLGVVLLLIFRSRPRRGSPVAVSA
ncbi:MAG: MFS transporter [Pseudomonadota bacterium]